RMVTMFRFALGGCRSGTPENFPGTTPKKEREFYAVQRSLSKRSCPAQHASGENRGFRPRPPLAAAGHAHVPALWVHARWQTALERSQQLPKAAALHALHHPLHLQELLHQPVDVLNLHP